MLKWLILLAVVFFIFDIFLLFLVWNKITTPSAEITTVTDLDLSNLTPNTNTPPDELVINFDKAKTPVKFRVSAFDNNTKTLSLTIVYPNIFLGETYKSKINCQDDDIKVDSEQTAQKDFFNKITNTPLDQILFSGICNDNNCREIVSACEIYTNQ